MIFAQYFCARIPGLGSWSWSRPRPRPNLSRPRSRPRPELSRPRPRPRPELSRPRPRPRHRLARPRPRSRPQNWVSRRSRDETWSRDLTSLYVTHFFDHFDPPGHKLSLFLRPLHLKYVFLIFKKIAILIHRRFSISTSF